jgi:hypothetical protein
MNVSGFFSATGKVRMWKTYKDDGEIESEPLTGLSIQGCVVSLRQAEEGE